MREEPPLTHKYKKKKSPDSDTIEKGHKKYDIDEHLCSTNSFIFAHCFRILKKRVRKNRKKFEKKEKKRPPIRYLLYLYLAPSTVHLPTHPSTMSQNYYIGNINS